MTLHEVDPTPEPAPEPAAAAPASPAITRGRALRWLKGVQKYSAYGILVFAGLHLTSTVVLPPFSVPAANSAFMVARDVYQSVVGERALVYGAFGVHVVSGLILRTVRIASRYTDFGKLGLGRPSAIAYSGLLLSVLTSLHFVALRAGPVRALGDSSLISLEYITFELSHALTKLTTGLVFLVSLFSYHALEGLNQYLHLKLRPATRYAAVAAVAAYAFASVSTLAAEPVPTGWLADQYHTAAAVTEQMMSGR